jgi:hypothetical protein
MTRLLGLLACPACYGAPDSPMTAGMNTAVLVMLGITGTVLVLLALSFLVLYRRAKKMREGLSGDLFVDERGTLKAKQGKGVVEWNNS